MDRRVNPPPQYRRRQRRSSQWCTCDCNYAKSLQGICKIIQLVILFLAWIIIAASPYWRPIFVIDGQTWPFHIVMLFTICAWLATLILYCMFMSGYHLSQGHKNWPKIELYFNICMVIMVLIALSIQAANVWRWDMSNGSVLTGSSSYSSYYEYGLRPGMSFTQTLNFNSYCAQRPRDCTDYFNLLAGNNSYYTNHLFAVVLLVFGLIAYLVSTFFAFRTWRQFERDMYKPGEIPKPTLWMRVQYQVEKATNNVRDKANKVLRRNNDEDEDPDSDEDDVDIKTVETPNKKVPSPDTDAGFDDHDIAKSSSRSEGRASRARSHSSHHTSHSHHTSRSHGTSRSHHTTDSHKSSSSGSKKARSQSSHVVEENGKESRDSTSHRSKSSSKRTEEPPPPYTPDKEPLVHAQPVGMLPFKPKKSKKDKKESASPPPMSPVASVMI